MAAQQRGRTWTYWLFLVGGVLTLQVAILVTIAGTSRATEPSRPNILIILTDDQRAEGTMEIGNQRWMDTTLGLFKDQGTEFRNGFASSPACCPARASIFSGRYSQNNHVRDNSEAGGHLDHDLTMQAYLDNDDPGEDPSLDYQTGIFGKFLNNWDLNRNPPHWDRWSVGGGYCPIDVNEQGTRKRYPPTASADECTVAGHPYGTTYFTDQAVNFLREANQDMDDKPWLLYVAPNAPHERGSVPADNALMADSNRGYDTASVPAFTMTDSQRERTDASLSGQDPLNISDKPVWVQKYGAGGPVFPKPVMSDGRAAPGLRTEQLRSLLSVDDMVDTVFNELRTLGEENNTLAFYLSDNGYMWREHGDAEIEHVWDVERRNIKDINGQVVGFQAWSWDCKPSTDPPGPDRYMGCPPAAPGGGLSDKTKPYTESIRVPFFARWPAQTGLITPGAVDSSVAANIDIAPTVMDAAGIPLPAGQPMDGISLLDRRRAQDEPILAQPPPIFGNQVSIWASLRGRDYQYIEYYRVDPDKPAFQEYYDVVDDPLQLKNLFGGNGVPETGDDVPGTGDDFPNAPSVAATKVLSRKLATLRRPAKDAAMQGTSFEDPPSNTHGFHYLTQYGGTLTRDSMQRDMTTGGAYSGKVHRNSGTGWTITGDYDIRVRDGENLSYGGRFYLPPAGVMPGQGLEAGKKLMLMQWDNERYGVWNRELADQSASSASSGDYGGIAITPKPNSVDYEARLVRGHRPSFGYAGLEETIGEPFTVPGGRWVFLWVWQFLSPNDAWTTPAGSGTSRAANYVYFSDGTAVGSSWLMWGNPKPNAFGRGVDHFRYGVVSYNGTQALDVWLDGLSLAVYPLRPKGTDVQTRNGTIDSALCPTAPTQNKPDDCDQVIYSFDKPIDPVSVVPGWDGTGTRQVNLVINGDSGEPNSNGVRNDVVEFPDIPALGKVDLGRNDYVSAIPRSFSTSLLSMSADMKTITATLDGGTVGAGPFTTPSTMTWKGYSAIRDTDGTAAGAPGQPEPLVVEGGAADREF